MKMKQKINLDQSPALALGGITVDPNESMRERNARWQAMDKEKQAQQSARRRTGMLIGAAVTSGVLLAGNPVIETPVKAVGHVAEVTLDALGNINSGAQDEQKSFENDQHNQEANTTPPQAGQANAYTAVQQKQP